jgi:hypothetical protein
MSEINHLEGLVQELMNEVKMQREELKRQAGERQTVHSQVELILSTVQRSSADLETVRKSCKSQWETRLKMTRSVNELGELLEEVYRDETLVAEERSELVSMVSSVMKEITYPLYDTTIKRALARRGLTEEQSRLMEVQGLWAPGWRKGGNRKGGGKGKGMRGNSGEMKDEL